MARRYSFLIGFSLILCFQTVVLSQEVNAAEQHLESIHGKEHGVFSEEAMICEKTWSFATKYKGFYKFPFLATLKPPSVYLSGVLMS